jgi:hypothetical protein
LAFPDAGEIECLAIEIHVVGGLKTARDGKIEAPEFGEFDEVVVGRLESIDQDPEFIDQNRMHCWVLQDVVKRNKVLRFGGDELRNKLQACNEEIRIIPIQNRSKPMRQLSTGEARVQRNDQGIAVLAGGNEVGRIEERTRIEAVSAKN